MGLRQCVLFVICILCLPANFFRTAALSQVTSERKTQVLTNAEVSALMPPSVYFRGQVAPVQMRNSGGVRLPAGGYLLVSLVDTSGYASDVQERYQAYVLLDNPVSIGGHVLSPGAYGCGFLKNDQFVVLDLGGHDLFVTGSHRDQDLRRPNPFQIRPSPESSEMVRLYAGRNFVSVMLSPAR